MLINIFLKNYSYLWLYPIVIVIYKLQRSTCSFIFFLVYEQHVWWLLETLSGQSGICFPLHTLPLCLMFRVCPIDRLMRNVSPRDWLDEWTVRKTFIVLWAFPYDRVLPSTKSLFIVLSLREEKCLEAYLKNCQMGFRELYIPILIGNNSCIFTFYLLPDTKLPIAKRKDFFFPYYFVNKRIIPLY